MSEEKKELIEIPVWGKGTEAEMEAKKKAIESGEELLPDGSKYPDKKDEVHVKILWEIIEEDPFGSQYFKGPKQILDIMLRTVETDDLQLPLDLGIERKQIEIAIQGGLNSVDLTFEEKNILYAVEAAFSDEAIKQGGKYPREISLTRADLYNQLGIEWRERPDGSRYRAEALGYQRKRIEKTLLDFSDKPFPFVFKIKTGQDKKGKPIWTVALTRTPLIRVLKIFENVKQEELPGIIRHEAKGERRFTHYQIQINKNAIGEIEHYFRYLPRFLGKKISDYRRSRRGKSTAAELNFIEYLYATADKRSPHPEKIEINFLKLAKKLKIKTLDRPNKVRITLRRCYETARALDYVLRVEEDQPGTRNKKDVIFLNVNRFPSLK